MTAAIFAGEKVDVAKIVAAEENAHGKIKFVFLRGKNRPRRLLVCFGAMGNGYYSRLSWYWQADGAYKDAYLFLSDPSNTFYFGKKGDGLCRDYEVVIERAIADCGVSRRDVALVGNSMGGYAAIHYAIRLGLPLALASNPQVDRESATLNPSPTWLKCMSAAEGFCDLTDIIGSAPELPFIYLEYGRFAADVAAAGKLVAALQAAHARFAVTSLTGDDHHSTTPTRHQIEAIGTFVGLAK
ncbi:hypothetical protein KEU06_05460 [Pseudaminobacter sp. 19-2017]|uniref:Alpha/beta hydrolase n=1 Tax=Pseudaminobacter soli (ex Zhang et al. 2022) TaxID=2831468 RepID=A0A942I228_9HYPH|nr:hypothetical protein [Pseudaminobacter soli]MBS3648078.1 hypothetical protein [Pseudaminobacter soli]